MKIKDKIRPIFNWVYTKIYSFKNYKPIFIVGCGHSGTTLILRILSTHSKIMGINYESYAFNKGLAGFKLFQNWEKKRKDNGQKYWLEKTPRHVRYLDQIFKIFPKAKIIVLVRNGKDVAVSIKKRYGRIESGINRWIDDNEKALEYTNHSNLIFLKLEDFTKNPEKELEGICSFLDIEYSKDLLNYHTKEFNYENKKVEKAKDVEDGKGHAVNRNWQVNQPIFKNTERWKKESTPNDKIAFQNKKFQRLLAVYGYNENIADLDE